MKGKGGVILLPYQKAVGIIPESLAIKLRNEGFKQNHQNDLKKIIHVTCKISIYTERYSPM